MEYQYKNTDKYQSDEAKNTISYFIEFTYGRILARYEQNLHQ